MRMLPLPSARPLAGRKIRSVLLAICLHGILAAPASSQITWQWLNPLPQGNLLMSVSFQNPSEGWVAGSVGDLGVILRTTDVGESWTTQSSPTQEWLHGVYFTSAMHGVACGADERILLTTDGGATWTIRSEGPLQQYSYQSIVMEDTLNGLAIGDEGMAARTTDGGMIWVELPRPTGSNLFGLRFQGPGRAIAVGGTEPSCATPAKSPLRSHPSPERRKDFASIRTFPTPSTHRRPSATACPVVRM